MRKLYKIIIFFVILILIGYIAMYATVQISLNKNDVINKTSEKTPTTLIEKVREV